MNTELNTARAPASVDAQDATGPLTADHVMISTDDFDATLGWYQDVLGFRLVHQWTVPDLPGLKLGYMERDGFMIEIVETPSAMGDTNRPQNLGDALNRRGFGHLAFLVPDVDALADVLKSRGVEFFVEPTSFPVAGRRLIFVYDNNGNLLEFLTPLRDEETTL